MRVLITGAGGFIGRHLLSGLREEGVQVFGAARSPAAPQEGLRACDLGSFQAFDSLVGDLAPDAIVHAAGSLLGTDPSLAVEGYFNNLLSTASVIEAAVKRRVGRVVFLSTHMVYGDSYQVQAGQEEAGAPANWYARAKHLCEHLLRDHAEFVETIVLRLPSVLGRDKKRGDLVVDMIRALRDTGSITVFGKGESRRQFVDMRDLTAVIRHCLERDMGGRRFLLSPVAGPEIRTIREIGESVLKLCGGGKLVFDSNRRDSPDHLIAPDLLRAKLGVELKISFEDSIKEILRGFPADGQKGHFKAY